MNKRSRYLVEKIHSMAKRPGKTSSLSNSPSVADVEIPNDVRMVFGTQESGEVDQAPAPDHEIDSLSTEINSTNHEIEATPQEIDTAPQEINSTTPEIEAAPQEINDASQNNIDENDEIGENGTEVRKIDSTTNHQIDPDDHEIGEEIDSSNHEINSTTPEIEAAPQEINGASQNKIDENEEIGAEVQDINAEVHEIDPEVHEIAADVIENNTDVITDSPDVSDEVLQEKVEEAAQTSVLDSKEAETELDGPELNDVPSDKSSSKPVPATEEPSVDATQEADTAEHSQETEPALDIPSSGDVISSVHDVFTTVSKVLEDMSSDVDDENDVSEALKQLKSSDFGEVDLNRFQSEFPGLPLDDVVADLQNFQVYYTNLTTDEGDDVLEIELNKRQVIYQAMAKILGQVPVSLARLLFVLGAKLFIAAFYAISEGCNFDRILEKTIFHAKPGLGVNVEEIFDDHMLDFFTKGCEILDVDADFCNIIAQDCISLTELHLFVNM